LPSNVCNDDVDGLSSAASIAKMTRAATKRSEDGPQARRFLALAAIYDGATRTAAAEIGGVTVQIVRDWAIKFSALAPMG
jgi:transposase